MCLIAAKGNAKLDHQFPNLGQIPARVFFSEQARV